jgi:hypothetical protein
MKTSLPSSSKNEAKRPILSSIQGIYKVAKALKSKTANLITGLDFIIQASQDLVIKLKIATYKNKELYIALVKEKKY